MDRHNTYLTPLGGPENAHKWRLVRSEWALEKCKEEGFETLPHCRTMCVFGGDMWDDDGWAIKATKKQLLNIGIISNGVEDVFVNSVYY
jgi:hypothetical protein|tara:strand:- start:941 stop:1207 length:267 start_codon:yes stop_codon:yes gene_type:complete